MLGEAPGPADVDVGASQPRSLPEVSLRQLGVVRPPQEAATLDLRPVRVDRLEIPRRDLDIDDRLGVESRDSGRPDVVDAKSEFPELGAEAAGELREQLGPLWIVGNDQEFAGHFEMIA